MIKIRTIQLTLLLFCTLPLLNSCKSTTTLPAEQTTDNNKPSVGVQAKGMILQQGITTYQYGTHVLNDKDGKTTYALKSETLKLDNYIGKTVELEGIPVEGYPIEGGPEYLEVTKIKKWEK